MFEQNLVFAGYEFILGTATTNSWSGRTERQFQVYNRAGTVVTSYSVPAELSLFRHAREWLAWVRAEVCPF